MTEPLQLQNFIDGRYVEPRDDARTELVDPTDSETYGYAPLSGQADVDLAYESAAKAFKTWGSTTPAQRQEALSKMADAYEARLDELIAAESRNTGKLIPLLKSEEMPMFLDQLRFFAGAARVLEGRASAEYMEGHTSWIRREPVGVVGQVAPWNYPMLMALWKIAPALAAGNAVVLKPSDTTPHTALLMAEIAAEFLPPGTLNVICGDRTTGNLVVTHPTAAMVSITGSVGAGMAVAKAASDDLKRVHLELGGKAPVVVFDDADVASAAQGIAEAAYFNAGQDCTAATRVLVAPQIHDEFVAALVEQARGASTSYENGSEDEDALVPPLNNKNQLDRVLGFLSRVPDHATVAAGGNRQGDRGFYVEPTVITGLEQEDELIQNEIFGPVITVQTFQHEDEAIAKANGVPYALASSVWTKDFGRALRMSNALDFGCVWINTHIPLVAEMPHGGFKHSGYGKDLSMYGLEDYTRIKHVMASTEG